MKSDMLSSVEYTKKVVHRYQRNLSTTAATKAGSTKKTKSPGDIFLDNLGTIFLSGIGLLILALIRSSRGTSNKNNLRALIETTAALDPFEIDDLRVANDQFTPEVFRKICDELRNKHGWTMDQIVDYKLFVSAVMNEMKKLKGDAFTIQLGHLVDRVIVSIIENMDKEGYSSERNVENEEFLEMRLLLVALSLATKSSVRERVEMLYDIILDDHIDTGKKEVVHQSDVSKMVGHLQKTCQLVPDAQIIESDTKYPAQEYLVGTPEQLLIHAKEMKKDELSTDALEDNENGWSCDDFHHILRSRAVCAWGECYVKTKGLK